MPLYYKCLICQCIMRDSYVIALGGTHMSQYYEGLTCQCIMTDTYVTVL